MFENLSYKARRRWALVVLLIWLPFYVVLAVTILNRIGVMPIYLSVPVYLAVGVAWILPFKGVFKGIGQPDPDEQG
ncbi:DUF2842 domain-containing protein [Rhodobacteraceae bacterium D3-12]|nr:DUF2842 domain-containing protein [Rhodobacteraceae bacterium D3-12]